MNAQSLKRVSLSTFKHGPGIGMAKRHHLSGDGPTATPPGTGFLVAVDDDVRIKVRKVFLFGPKLNTDDKLPSSED